MYIAIGSSAESPVAAQEYDDDGTPRGGSIPIEREGVAAFVAAREASETPRWVWDDTTRWYSRLLAEGVRVARCHDLRLAHAILRSSTFTAATEFARLPEGPWDAAPGVEPSGQDRTALFEFTTLDDAEPDTTDALNETGAELRRQLTTLAGTAEPGRLRLLLAAESAGALIAAEMRFAGLPWSTAVHDDVLTRMLGPRVPYGQRPRRLEELLASIRAALDDETVNPDSQQDLLRALQRAGIVATSTRAWELQELDHPVIGPLLEYKKLARLLTANGWAWMDAWIVDGRFRPDYVPGGAATGRWVARGGGALQLPRQVRSAVRADPGWKLVVADAAQLEPRILAALSGDTDMAAAGRDTDLYTGIVATGVVDTRAHAKVAMLGAMYGATTGESGRLFPKLARAYPRAIALVESAARAGERGVAVTSRLGRSSPLPGVAWQAAQARASATDASGSDERRARSTARDWGRFTRNFVVQASAAEWALCWMAELRKALTGMAPDAAARGQLDGSAFAGSPHLVFFLHDEVIVHTPAALADDVAGAVERAAAEAGRLLFGGFPVDFPLGLAVVDSYAEAK